MGIKNQVILNLATAIGSSSNRISIATSASFVLISLFYAYSVASYLNVLTYPFLNRIIYYEFFHSFIFSQFIDHIIIISLTAAWFMLSARGKLRLILPAIYCGGLTLSTLAGAHVLFDITILLSMPAIIVLLILNRFLDQKRLKILNNKSNTLLINYFAIAGTVIGIMGLIISLVPVFSISHPLIDARNYEYDLYLILSSFSAILLLLLLSCLPVKKFTSELRIAISHIKHTNNTHLINSINDSNNNESVNSKYKLIYISLFMALSIIVGLIPHQIQINFEKQQIGVDTDYYIKWINALMHAANYKDFVHQAFVIQSSGDRPLTLIFLFTIAKILNVVSIYLIIEHVPLVLGPLLVLAVFFLTRELTVSDKQAILASFFTSISFQVTVGIYAGFYANWLALIIGYLSFVFLVRSLRYSSHRLNVVAFLLLVIACLFTHVHTWSVIVAVMIIF